MTTTGGERDAPRTQDDAFSWCTEESLADADSDSNSDFDFDAGGFEWAPPLNDSPSGHPSDKPVETLDPTLVTSRRLPSRDDDAVTLLAMLKHDPAGGRWRRAESEFVENGTHE